MNKFFVAVGQIVVGVAIGNVASDAFNKLVVKPIEKVIEAKKGGA